MRHIERTRIVLCFAQCGEFRCSDYVVSHSLLAALQPDTCQFPGLGGHLAAQAAVLGHRHRLGFLLIGVTEEVCLPQR